MLTLAGWSPSSGTKRAKIGSVGDQLKSTTFSTFKDFLSISEKVSVSYTEIMFFPILAKYLSSLSPAHLGKKVLIH